MLKTKVPHMDLRSKTRVFKRLLTAFLAIYQMEGIVSVALGLFLFMKLKSVHGCFYEYQINVASLLLITAGALSMIVCTIGVISTVRASNSRFLRPFFGFFVVLIVLELTAALVSTDDKNKLDDKTFYESMETSLDLLKLETDEEEQKEKLTCWMRIQRDYNCCGVDGYTAWINDTALHESNAEAAMESCSCGSGWRKKELKCMDISTTVGTIYMNMSIYTATCHDALYSVINYQTVLIRAYCSVLAVIQIIAFGFMSWFIAKIQKGNAVEIYGVNFNNNTNKARTTSRRDDIFSVSNENLQRGEE